MKKLHEYRGAVLRSLPDGRELPCVCTSDFPKAIVHVDMDSFFASVAQEQDHRLRNKPVTVGMERGIATAMSAEAKALGVTRGMKNSDILRCAPGCILVPSDYETIGLFSRRLFSIVRQYTEDVEEYSVDECFADITGMRRVHNMTYDQICVAIKHDIDTKLGTRCSVGLAPTKTLAKIASKLQKPNGFSMIPGRNAQYYLAQTPLEKVWGIGEKRAHYMKSLGMRTALDFAYTPLEKVQYHCYKPEIEIWHELRGVMTKHLNTEGVTEYQSISKRKTFTPSTNNKEEVWSRLCKNVENACMKARRYGLGAKHAYFSLRTNNFLHHGADVELEYVCNDPMSFIEALQPYFESVWDAQKMWRTTQFGMTKLREMSTQKDLFGYQEKTSIRGALYTDIDAINARFGKHAVKLGSSLYSMRTGDHQGLRGTKPWRKKPENWIPGETARKRVDIPYTGDVN